MKTGRLVVVFISAMLLWQAPAAAVPHQSEQKLKAGKKGEITLSQPTKVGDIVLQPDTYVIQHRVSKGNHFVRFVELRQVEVGLDYELPRTTTEMDKVGEIKCRLEPAAAPIIETSVYTVPDNGGPRITKIMIKGESVVHLL